MTQLKKIIQASALLMGINQNDILRFNFRLWNSAWRSFRHKPILQHDQIKQIISKEYTGSLGGSKIKMELGQTFLWASCGGLDSIYLRIQPIKLVTSKNRKKVYAISKLQSKGE
jgi:hypothetical protein